MARRTKHLERLDDHPNLEEVLGVLAQLVHVRDDELPRLAAGWRNSPSAAEARGRALSADSPLVCEVLAAFDALTALFEDELADAPWATVGSDVTTTALKAIRDAIAAAYARPVLTKTEHALLMAPWRQVYPTATIGEPDLGPEAPALTGLLAALPSLAVRCHDPRGQALYERLLDLSYVDEGDRAEAREGAFQVAVLTSRRRVWALVRRTGAEGVTRVCPQCRRSATRADDGDALRVLALCLDAACALLVADALPDYAVDVLVSPVRDLIPEQRRPSA